MQQSVMYCVWCFALQTSMDRCTQLVLHPLRNVQPVQLVVQEMAETASMGVFTAHKLTEHQPS